MQTCKWKTSLKASRELRYFFPQVCTNLGKYVILEQLTPPSPTILRIPAAFSFENDERYLLKAQPTVMTPELKIACEVVFQEHKTSSYPVTWNRDAFRGRLSTGLTEMAKDTLLRKNIIYYPNPTKKINTVLNPTISGAESFEEAENMILNKIPALSASRVGNQGTLVAKPKPVASFISRPVAHRLVTLSGETETVTEEIKWYMKPVFFYIVWPLLAAVLGGLIAFLMGTIYTELVFDLK
ncbi:MAG: hypothetical protein ABI675_05620 [Chitinophagaceae bacterium]